MTDKTGEKKSNAAKWRQRTRLVRGGQERSAFEETSEGLFLTSGYVYGTATERPTRRKKRSRAMSSVICIRATPILLSRCSKNA